MRYAGLLLLGTGLLGWMPGALAYDGSQAEQEACTPDVFSLCSAYIPNEDPILACLKAKRVQLSPACATVLFPARRSRRSRS